MDAVWADASHTSVNVRDGEHTRLVPADMTNADYRALVENEVQIAEPAASAAEQLAAIQARRAKAILGFVYNSVPVNLTPDTQRDVGNAVQGLSRQPAGSTLDWEIVDGVYVTMDIDALLAFGGAAFDHVQSCFTNSKRLTALLQSNQPYDLETGWPAGS